MSKTVDAEADVIHWNFDSGDDEDIDIERLKADGSPYDLTGWEFWLTIKDDTSQADADAALQITVTSHTDPTNGLTTITIPAADSADLEYDYVYDIQEKKASGKIQTLMKGNMSFAPDVTEAT